MVEPKLVLVADWVIQDATTRTMSVISIHEQFYPVGYPLLIPRFIVFSMYQRAPEDPAVTQATLVIILDNETLFEKGDVEINFGAGLTHRSIVRFDGFVLPHAGNLKVRVTAGDQSIESYTMPAFPVGTPVPQIA